MCRCVCASVSVCRCECAALSGAGVNGAGECAGVSGQVCVQV